MIAPAQTMEASPGARLTGVVYLLYFLTAILAQVLDSRNFHTYGQAANLIAYGFYLALVVRFYYLFKPVDRKLSFLAAALGVLGCCTGMFQVFDILPQVNPLLFFGFYCVMLGSLVLRSTFLPRVIGALLILAGLGWLIYLVPAVQYRAATDIMVLGIVAEASLMLWLVAFGVNVQRWKAAVN